MDDDEPPTLKLKPPVPEADVSLRETITEQTLAAWRAESERITRAMPDARESSSAVPRLPSITFGPTEDGADVGADEDAVHTTNTVRDLEVKSVLGEGGMGTVYLARQHSLRREVAVKTVRGALLSPTARPNAVGDHVDADRARAARTLVAEARITGALEHPNIVPVHQLGVDEQRTPVLVMKRVEGVVWRDLVYARDATAWASVPVYRGDALAAHVEILMQVCNALHFAHARGIVHRDLKPENVMIGAYGEVYLVDWGVACTARGPLTESQGAGSWETVVGTPVYMAPEMVTGGAVDARTDVFLLGAVLHEVLTRSVRHEGAMLTAVLLRAMRPAPVAYGADVPEALAALANAATRALPDERPASAMAFRSALADWLSHRGSVALADAAREQLRALVHAMKPEHSSEMDADAFARASIECRFGFAQALREWPGNRDAREGLRACVTALTRREIERGNPAAARALLAELGEPDPALAEEVAAAERADQARRESEARMRARAHENDLRVSARQRAWFFAGLAVASVVTALTGLVLSDFSRREFTRFGVVRFSVVLFAAIVLALALGRRALLRTEINRKLALMPLLGAGAFMLHRVQGVWLGTDLRHIVASDLLLLASMGATATLLVLPRFALPTLALFGGAVYATFVPDAAQATFNVAGALGMLSLVFLWRGPRQANRLRDGLEVARDTEKPR